MVEIVFIVIEWKVEIKVERIKVKVLVWYGLWFWFLFLFWFVNIKIENFFIWLWDFLRFYNFRRVYEIDENVFGLGVDFILNGNA